MQQPRRISLLQKLFGARPRQPNEPKKGLPPLDQRQLNQVAGGTTLETGNPRNVW
jgi:hypothetical protein